MRKGTHLTRILRKIKVAFSFLLALFLSSCNYLAFEQFVLHLAGEDADLSVHFLELGNEYAGDSTLIKVGDTEVLIDAGSTRESADTINSYLKKYCWDGVLEYVIVTHAHQDHIAAFVGTEGSPGVFSRFKTEIIIDYAQSDSTTKIRKDYEQARDLEVKKGAKHYTALECWNRENGAKRSYELGENITFEILYQKYYEEKAIEENDYSVCILLSENDNHYLFTGDLELSGEESLVESNDLPKCKLYKAGHHGSKTSSNEVLLDVIQPEIVCVNCCCGSNQYTENKKNQFPTQAFVDRISVWTDKVYVTTITSQNSNFYESMNGNIVVSSFNGDVRVDCSNNNILLKNTAWFE